MKVEVGQRNRFNRFVHAVASLNNNNDVLFGGEPFFICYA